MTNEDISNRNALQEQLRLLLSEMHNIDKVAETHAQIIVAIMSVLLIFLFKENPFLACIIGGGLSIEFLFKAIRHRHILRTTNRKIRNVEWRLAIDAKYSVARVLGDNRFFSYDGLTILIYLAIFFIATWLGLFIVSWVKTYGATNLPLIGAS